MPTSRSDLEQLKAYWYQKLKESGFEDAENAQGYLKDWHTTRFTKDYTPERFIEKQLYYRLASQLLHDHVFESDLDEAIWHEHSEGKSLREIVQRLRTRGTKLNKDRVRIIIKHYAKFIRRENLDEDGESD